MELLPGSGSRLVSTPFSGFTGSEPGISFSILFLFDSWLLLRGSELAFSGPESSPVFSGSDRDFFFSSPFFKWLYIFGELGGIFGDCFVSKFRSRTLFQNRHHSPLQDHPRASNKDFESFSEFCKCFYHDFRFLSEGERMVSHWNYSQSDLYD